MRSSTMSERRNDEENLNGVIMDMCVEFGVRVGVVLGIPIRLGVALTAGAVPMTVTRERNPDG